MDSIFNEVCISVTAAFALTVVPGLTKLKRGTALLVFVMLALIEEATVSHASLIHERIVAVCAAGLVAGPWVGLAVSVFVTWLAVAGHGLPLSSIATSTLCAGLVGGWLHQWRPKLAQDPLTGFVLTLAVSLLRSGLFFLYASSSQVALKRLEEIGMAPLLQGLGTALILAIIEQVRNQDEQARAAAAAEVRALQARMNPHFLGNALNAIAALAVTAPGEVPSAAGRLRQFLRASFDQHEQALVPLEEELALISAYLHIESLRFGSRLKVDQAIDPGLLKVLIPPFSLQPLVENAVQHGLNSSPRARRVFLLARPVGGWLELSVSDAGQGVSPTEVEKVFFAECPRVHALVLLRRRLKALFGRSFQLEVRSKVGEGTTVTLRIPLRFEVANAFLEAVGAHTGQLAAG
jgi:two-component system sensor histidine kinase LytS